MNKLLMRTISAFIFSAALLAYSAGSAFAAGNTVMSVSATILSNSNCRFRTPTYNVSFGVLDPMSGLDVTASATTVIRCVGSAPLMVYMVTHDSGLYETGPGMNRMRHTTDPTAYLPYSLVISPDTDSFPREVAPQDHFVTVTGTVLATSYQTALQGNYADTVTLTIVP
jgi:spore coat protein U-like protein